MTVGSKIGWDDPVPTGIRESWERWRVELPMLTDKLVTHCYIPKDVHIASMQLHGFSDTSESAYAGDIMFDSLIQEM